MKKQRGITLIALIIAIIVLLILAGVSISILASEGLIERTIASAFKNEIKQYEEELKLSIYEDQIEKLGNRTEKFNVQKSSYDNDNLFINAMKVKIPSFDEKYVGKLEIREDQLQYTGNDLKERNWLNNLISVSCMLTIKYVDINGVQVFPTYQQVITSGNYEVVSPLKADYQPDIYTVTGEIHEDKEIIVTYYEESQGLSYEDIDENSCAVSGIGTFSGTILIIPKVHNGKDVIQIKENAFYGNNTLKTVNIADSVKEIKNDAFRTSNIENLMLGKNVQSIAQWAFGGCSRLKTVTIRTNDVKYSAINFNGDSDFTELRLDGNEDKYKIVDNILYSKDEKKIILCPPGKKGTFIVPTTVEIIGEYAFFKSEFKSIVISDNVTKILDSAFRASNIESIVIGKKVNSIAQWALGACSKLKTVTIRTENINFSSLNFNGDTKFTEIVLDRDDDTYSVSDGILYANNGKTLVFCATGKSGTLTIPDNVEVLGNGSFEFSNLTSVIIPNSVEQIGSDAFRGSKLESIVIGENVENIGSVWTFGGCDKLKTVTINSSPLVKDNLGRLLENRNTIYVNLNIKDDIGEYITTNYQSTQTDKEGYEKYIKN